MPANVLHHINAGHAFAEDRPPHRLVRLRIVQQPADERDDDVTPDTRRARLRSRRRRRRRAGRRWGATMTPRGTPAGRAGAAGAVVPAARAGGGGKRALWMETPGATPVSRNTADASMPMPTSRPISRPLPLLTISPWCLSSST